MKKKLFIIFAFSLFQFAFAQEAKEKKAPHVPFRKKVHKKFSCPKLERIDCMPMVKPEFEKFCAPAEREKIQKNCPNIQYTD